MKLYHTCILIILLLSGLKTFGREIIFGDETELLTIVHKEETILRFPAPVKTVSNVRDFVIGPVDKSDPDYTLLSIRPIFRKAKGKVLFVLDNGTVIRIKFKTVRPGMPLKIDSLYEFKSRKSVIEKKANLAAISELELMKAMVRGDRVTGYEERKLVRTVWNNNKKVRVKLIKIYTGRRFNGLIYEIRNRSKKSLKINPEKIFLGKPNQAIMAQLDDVVIYPKSIGKAVTYLRIVAKPTTTYKDIVLPFEQIRGEK